MEVIRVFALFKIIKYSKFVTIRWTFIVNVNPSNNKNMTKQICFY
jgi:hypothetical protein